MSRPMNCTLEDILVYGGSVVRALVIPDGCKYLMWNGYMSPYSSTGHDWMDGAEYVMPQEDVTDELCLLADDYVFMYNQINLKLHPVIDSHYAKYCKRELRKLTNQLAELGYAIVIS